MTLLGVLLIDQKYFLLGDETDELNLGFDTRTIIFDFSDLDNPQLHATFEGPTNAIDHNGYVKGNLFYLANYTRGLRVFDISTINDASNPMTEIGSFDTHPNNDGTSFNGAWSVYPFFSSDNILINDINLGLFVVKQSGTFSTGSEDLSKTSVFPNPVKNDDNLSITTQKDFEKIRVYNTLGGLVLSFNTPPTKDFEMPINNLTKGIYFVQIDNSSNIKLIVD